MDGSCLPQEEVEKPKVRDGHWEWGTGRGRAVSKEETTPESHELRDFGPGATVRKITHLWTKQSIFIQSRGELLKTVLRADG